jgi:hypothetical protein
MVFEGALHRLLIDIEDKIGPFVGIVREGEGTRAKTQTPSISSSSLSWVCPWMKIRTPSCFREASMALE